MKTILIAAGIFFLTPMFGKIGTCDIWGNYCYAQDYYLMPMGDGSYTAVYQGEPAKPAAPAAISNDASYADKVMYLQGLARSGVISWEEEVRLESKLRGN